MRTACAIIVAHDLATADEQFRYTVDRTPPGFRLQRIGRAFFRFLHAEAKPGSCLRT